jgi:hypothetical protein
MTHLTIPRMRFQLSDVEVLWSWRHLSITFSNQRFSNCSPTVDVPYLSGSIKCWKILQQLSALTHSPVEGEWPLLSSKSRPYFKTRKILETTEVWPWVPTGHETKIDCAGENQQQFTRPTGRVAERLTASQEGLSSMELGNQLDGCLTIPGEEYRSWNSSLRNIFQNT